MPRFFPYAPQGRGNFSHAPQAAYRSIVSSLPYLIGDLDPRPERRNASPFPTSVGQTSTAPGTAAGQDLAAIRGGHTLAEAVLLRALALLRLIGTKHGGHLLVQVQTPSIGRRIQTGVPVQQQPFGCGLYTNSPAKKGRKNPLSQDSVTYYRLRNPAVSMNFCAKSSLFFSTPVYSQYLVYFLSHIHNSQILL